MDQKYRLKGWYLLLNVIVALVTLSTLAGLTIALILILALMGFSFQGSQTGALLPLGMFAGILILFMGIFTLMGIILPLGNALFSYLKLSSTGLELRIWPFYRWSWSWHQVAGLERVDVLGGRLSLPMLRIRKVSLESQAEPDLPIVMHGGHGSDENPVSVPLALIASLVWSVKYKSLIPVYVFNGWPHGSLRRDLERRFERITPG
jgi:hypothetical protein